MCSGTRSPARQGPRLPGRGHAGIRRVHRRPQLGSDFALANREEMMDRVVEATSRTSSVTAARSSTKPSGSTATTTSPRRRSTWARTCGCPGRVRSPRRRGRVGAHPRLDGYRELRRVGMGNVPALKSAPTARVGCTHEPGTARRSPSKICGRDGGHRIQGFRGVHRRDPGARTRTSTQVMDDAKDLVEIRHTLHQIVNVKGD